MDAKILWPAPGREIEHWGMLLGMILGADPGYPMKRPFLLGIRGAAPFASETHPMRHVPAYDDAFVLFHADGKTAPLVFPGATHAYQKNSKESPDVNHDGVGDVGSILPGRYLMKPAAGKYPVFVITTPDGSPQIPCVRDIDHDGIPEADMGYFATGILFHCGYDAPADSDHKSSIGCQTANIRRLEMLASAAKGYDGIDYELRTAESLIVLLNSANIEPFPLDARANT